MTEWISVNDRLPENNEYVLAYNDINIYLLKFIQTTDKRHKIRSGYFDSSDENFHEEITHWMSLPERRNELD